LDSQKQAEPVVVSVSTPSPEDSNNTGKESESNEDKKSHRRSGLFRRLFSQGGSPTSSPVGTPRRPHAKSVSSVSVPVFREQSPNEQTRKDHSATSTPPRICSPIIEPPPPSSSASFESNAVVMNDNWKKKKAWAGLNAMGGPKPPSKSSSKSLSEMTVDEARAARKRYEDEIVFTEEDYVSKLKTVVSLFLEPLRSLAIDPNHHEVISMQEIQTVFSNIDMIYNLNSLLCEELLKWHNQGVGSLSQIFLKKADFLRVYFVYATNFAVASDRVLFLIDNNQKFADFVKKALGDKECEGLSLQAMLIMPVQRMPRYSLLLNEVIKHTHKDDPELPDLKLALEKIQKITSQMNTRIREVENRVQVQKIMGQLIFDESVMLPGNPTRLFVLEGDIFEYTESKLIHSYCYLFDDILVFANSKTHGRSSQRSVEHVVTFDLCEPVKQVSLSEGHHTDSSVATFAQRHHRKRTNPHLRGASEAEKDAYNCAFGLTISGDLHVLSSSSEAETRAWILAINKCIENIHIKQQSFVTSSASSPSP